MTAIAYTTEAIIREQTPFKNATNISAAYVARAISEATAIVDASVGSRYLLPLTVVPGIVSSITETLTAILLFKQQSTNVELEPGLSQEAAWDAQMEILNSIAKGILKLFDTTGLELPLSGSKKLGFYPTQASSDATDINSTAPYFTMNQTF